MGLTEFAGVERRKFVRVTAQVPLRIYFRGETLNFPGAFSRDVSTGGLGVELDAQYADVSGELLAYRGDIEVEIDLPDEDEPIKAAAEVRWVTRSDLNEGAVLMGLKFKELDDEQHERMADLVKDLVDAEYREKILAKYEKPPGRR